MLAVSLALALMADWRWRADLGAEINASSHGVLDLAVNQGPWTLALYTDTLDARYAVESVNGRANIGARVEAPAALLLSAPWSDGAPDPSHGRLAGYGGIDGEWVRYLGHGLYAGLGASLRVYWIESLGTIPFFAPELVLGYYRDSVELKISFHADLGHERAAPRLSAYARLKPRWVLAPFIEIRAAVAESEDDLTRTRLGGLNPYVVPLAGAGWAEFWVEDYAALRAGPSLTVGGLEVAAVVDLATFDGAREAGLALLARFQWERFFLESSVGYSPTIARQEGVLPLSVWARVGLDWSD